MTPVTLTIQTKRCSSSSADANTQKPYRLRIEAHVLRGFYSRLRGLLGTTAQNSRPVLLCNCSSIHSCGMRYSLDVAFISSRGKVLKSVRGLKPQRMCCCYRARFVLERAASQAPWPHKGEVLELIEELSESRRKEYKWEWIQ
ncbi:MAG: DUF192 domain-containing protein [Atopobiaceae bacterium]|nr:DUF192 domain-containing protein [Atopobiaceae bacterium]